MLSSEPVGASQVEGFGPEVRSKPHVAGSFFKGPPQQETTSNPACGRRKILGMGSRSTTRSLAKRLREGWKMYLGESGYGFKGAVSAKPKKNVNQISAEPKLENRRAWSIEALPNPPEPSISGCREFVVGEMPYLTDIPLFISHRTFMINVILVGVTFGMV